MDILEEPEEGVQPEVFRQEVAPEPEAAPAPPAPEPDPEPAPEPEAPPVTPDWLNAPVEPEPAAQPGPQYPPQPPPQYPPNAPPAQPPSGGLDAFIDNPDAYIDRIVNERLVQAVGPLAQSQQAIAMQTQMMKDAQMRSTVQSADGAINKAYQEFNKDSSFRSNKALQSEVAQILSDMRGQALYEASVQGDFRRLNSMASIGEKEIQATLAVAKIKAGTASPGKGPLEVAGAVVESATPTKPANDVVLTAEQEEVARRIGGNYADRLRQAIRETESAGDYTG